MINPVTRIQGTDGVRGEVALDSDKRVIPGDPIGTFVEKTLLTPSFARLYARTFIAFLEAKESLKKDRPVVVGYDPRDRDRVMINAVFDGITSAGMDVIDAGVIPTPCCGMYTVQAEAAAGIMITASHNPADQNGIKLFLPETGLKLFPSEEEEFTALMYQSDFNDQSKKGTVIRHEDEIRSMIFDFFHEPFNSWKKEGDFNNVLLVVDSANGAFAEWSGHLLEKFNFRLVEEVGNDLNTEINSNCGAGLYEGHKKIDAGFNSDKGTDFRKVDLVQALFRHGRANREEVASGHLRVAGAAFDGDGDRFYGFEYDPFQDAVIIMSGDEVAFIQAAFIKESLGEEYNKIAEFVTTVESDIAVSVAAEAQGLIPVISGVGDKWLLWESWASLLGMYWTALEVQSNNMEMLADLEEIQELFAEEKTPQGLILSKHLRAAVETARDEEIDLMETCLKPDMINFTVGSEETGHSVTMGLLKGVADPGTLVFFGNGFKSALNLLAATEKLHSEKDIHQFYSFIEAPFKPGFKATFPIYYTDKSLLAAGSRESNDLEKAILDSAEEKFASEYTVVSQRKNSEPDMIFIEIQDKEPDSHGNQVLRGTVFVRNSGTEAKTSVYARCEMPLKEAMLQVCMQGALLVADLMKDPANPYHQAEKKIINHIKENGPSVIADLTGYLAEVNPQRLILEMTLKQGILAASGEKLGLTEFGAQIKI